VKDLDRTGEPLLWRNEWKPNFTAVKEDGSDQDIEEAKTGWDIK
jgi:hypothetical protein